MGVVMSAAKVNDFRFSNLDRGSTFSEIRALIEEAPAQQMQNCLWYCVQQGSFRLLDSSPQLESALDFTLSPFFLLQPSSFSPLQVQPFKHLCNQFLLFNSSWLKSPEWFLYSCLDPSSYTCVLTHRHWKEEVVKQLGQDTMIHLPIEAKSIVAEINYLTKKSYNCIYARLLLK